ncbi:MAG TPA: hypothetical protein VK885_01370, partial [Desulfotignum sp.]|nr:hypothetical protein [Desulfotignum sp.]
MPVFLSQNQILLLFPVFFLIIFLISMGVVLVLRQRQKTREMVRKIQHGGLASDETSAGRLPDKRALLLGETEPKSSLISFFSFFSGQKGRQVLNMEQLGAMKIKFLQAGIKSRHVDAAFYGAKLFFPVLLVFVFLVIKLFFYPTLSNTYAILILVLLGLFGFYLPDIWLKQKTDKRKILLFKSLPDALDLLVVCVEAGMGLD